VLPLCYDVTNLVNSMSRAVRGWGPLTDQYDQSVGLLNVCFLRLQTFAKNFVRNTFANVCYFNFNVCYIYGCLAACRACEAGGTRARATLGSNVDIYWVNMVENPCTV
jgi:hypothetical protein